MRNRLISKTIQTAAIVLAAQLSFTITPARAQLDETCTVTVNGQTVNVGFGGEFNLGNIPAGPDLFRVYAICTKEGKTRYGRSGFFQIVARQTFTLSELDMQFRDTPFATPSTIRAVAEEDTLIALGQNTQIRVTVTFSDGSQKELNTRGLGTSYRTSNPNVITVDDNGVVTAVSAGVALITATNEGVSAITRIQVIPLELRTSVEGFVQFDDGRPAPNATVIVSGFGGSDTTGADGRFAISGYSGLPRPLTVTAFIPQGNELLIGKVSGLMPIANGITDAGIIKLTTGNYVFWVNTGSGTWNTAGNWNVNRVPNRNDDVIISVPANIIVTHNTGTDTVKSLLSLEAFTLSAGSLTVLTDSEIKNNFTFSGGTLSGSGDFAVSGTFNWTTGTMSGAGSTTLSAGGVMNISGTGSKTLNGRTFNNVGQVTWTGTGNIAAGTGAVFNNFSLGTFEIQNNLSFTNFGSPMVFNNIGTFTRSIGTATTSVINGPFNNTGGVQVQSGTLNLVGGGTSTGSFNLATDALLRLSGNHNLATGTRFSGSGFAQVLGGGILTISGPVTLDNFSLPTGTLTGPGDFTVTSTLEWTGGTMSGTGRTVLRGTMSAVSGSRNLLGRTFDNAGTVNWTGGSFTVDQEGVFNNLAGATFTVQNNTQLFWGGTGTFNNAGTFTKSTGTGTISFQTTSIFNNTGVVDIRSGVMRIVGSGTNSGSFTAQPGTRLEFGEGLSARTYNLGTDGSITVPHVIFIAGTVNLDGTYNVNGSTTIQLGKANFTGNVVNVGDSLIIRPAGTANFSNREGRVSINRLIFSGGTLTGSSDVIVTGLLDWTIGRMSGAGNTISNGTMQIRSGFGNRSLAGRTLANAGTAFLTGTASIIFSQGAVFNNLSNGTFNVQNDQSFTGAGVFNNAGTFIKSASNGITQMRAGTVFNNNGTVDLQTGTLQLAHGGTSSGSFTGLPGTKLEFAIINFKHELTATSSITVPYVDFSSIVNVLGTYDVRGSTIISTMFSVTNFSGRVVNVGDSLNIISGTANFSNTEGVVAVNRLNQTSGTLTGSSNVIVNSLLNWRGGNMSGSGKTTANGASTFSGSLTLSGRAFDNAGNVTWTGTGSISMTQNAPFTNLAGSVFEAQYNVSFSGNGTFTNAGTFRKRVATGPTTFSGVAFINNGTVDMQSGTLSLSNKYIQASSGTLNLSIGGLTPGTQFSRLTVSGSPAPAATLNGTLNVNLVNNFTPALGNSFQILTFNTRGNTCFDQINLPPLPPGVQWQQVDCTTPNGPGLILRVIPGVAKQ